MMRIWCLAIGAGLTLMVATTATAQDRSAEVQQPIQARPGGPEGSQKTDQTLDVVKGTRLVLSNNAGGILGGISTGQDIIASIALKPTSSIRIPGRSVNTRGEPVEVVTTGRHDPCVGIRATPIAEAMIAIVLMDHLLRHRAQNMDVRSATPVIPPQAG